MTESLFADPPAAASQQADSARLFLLDGMALLYRSHYALIRSPRMTSQGLCTSAIFGLVTTISDLIKREQPTHLAMALDTPEPTQRHLAFPQYKAQREEMPEDLSRQLPYLDRLLEALRIRCIRMPGYEADDVIGTLAKQAAQADIETWMVTPDKDYDQLVSEQIRIYRPGRKGAEFEKLGVGEVLRKWDIDRVEQVIDILGLMGDSSDNVPGVPGIGPKTAQKLIKRFDSIENLLANIDQLKGKQREMLATNADQARLSKQLVTIQLDVPHSLQLDQLRYQGPDLQLLQELFVELEFETLGKRFFGDDFSITRQTATLVRETRQREIQASLFGEPTTTNTIEDTPHQYHTVTDQAERAGLIAELLNQREICFDTETTGLNPHTATPLGLAFAFAPHTAYYVVCPDDPEGCQQVLEEFRCVFENPAITKIGQNLKYDISILKWQGISVVGPLFDTMLAHAMLEPEMRQGLDYLANLYLNYNPISIKELIGPDGKDQRSMRDVSLQRLAEYACEDADVTLRVARILESRLSAAGLRTVCYEVEFPLIPVLVDMEYEGIRLDSEALVQYAEKLAHEIGQLQTQIFAAAGHEFNIDSPKQLGVVLFDELQLEANPKKTATGQYSTREAELERLSSRHGIVAHVLEYRNAVKLKSTYVDQLPGYVDPRTGRVHTHYSQSWTATGRMQSNNPNLQTIPIRKARGKGIRAAFVARDENHLLLSADYSQIELRIMAELSGDQGMLDAFGSNTDIHAVTASKVYKVPLEEVSRSMRDKAKTVNFGIIYGISSFGLQQRLNISRSEAQELIRNYFEKYPGVQRYIDQTIAFAKQNGYVQTLTGRRRYLRDIDSRNRTTAAAAERLAMNSPIQGTAADLLKLALTKVHRALTQGAFRTKMLLSVHDEIVFDMPINERDTVMPVIEQAMRTALPLKVPVVVEMGTGKNWLEAH